jgi:DNA-binding transcriptional regulator GbsR (MarR family)
MQKQTTFRETHLSLAERMVFSYLLLYAQGARCAQHSKNQIAQTTRLSVERVSVALKKLEALGLLHVHRTPGEANIYFCYPPRGAFESVERLWLMAKWLTLQ